MVKSVQVAATWFDGVGFNVVPENDPQANFYSVYTRDENGLAANVEDFNVLGRGSPMARILAFAKAAELAMEHQVTIEKIY